MKIRIILCLTAVLFGGLGSAKAQTPTPTPTPTAAVADGYYFNDSVAGQRITIPGKFTDVSAATVSLKVIETGRSRDVKAVIAEDKNSLSLDLPSDLESGRYKVTINLIGKSGALPPLVMPTELRVPPPPALNVTVEKVRPKDDYPYPNANKLYDFEISGSNFARDLPNNHVEINGVPLDLKYADAKNSCPGNPCLRAEPGNETRKLIVQNYTPPGYSHPLEVSVRVGNGNNVAKAADPLIFSSLSKTYLQWAAIGTFLLLVGVVFLLVRIRYQLRKTEGEKFWSLTPFLIDKDTNSYSLSKFQLTLFTLVTIFGYIYLFVCHLFVQWKFALPPIPENLPTMAAVSVGTSVVAAGIGARIGGKGAGPESPSFADFISSGGVVLPERFQFFLWTIVSSGAVLALILASDPATISQLPKLPDGMLYLMGISSAGYLGGKLVRGPGPSVRSADFKRENGLVVVLNGDNLSNEATYQLDEEHIPVEDGHVSASTPEPGGNPTLCSMLEVHFKKAQHRFFDGTHTLTIINPDSQAAVVRFGTTIESVTKTSSEEDPVKFSVVGASFVDPSSARWITANGVVNDLGTAAITKKSDTELEIVVPAAFVGADPITGKLSIVSPGGLTTTFDLEKKSLVPSPPEVNPVPPGQEPPGQQPPGQQPPGQQASGEQQPGQQQPGQQPPGQQVPGEQQGSKPPQEETVEEEIEE